jgi:hypothetical protein
VVQENDIQYWGKDASVKCVDGEATAGGSR